MDKYRLIEFLNNCTELFHKTNSLYQKTVNDPKNPSPIVSVYLSEIYTLSEKAKLFLAMNEELAHYEITSLFNFWNDVYFELKEVIEQRDRNTSWLYSEFENYKRQHEIVERMLKDQIQQLN
ncbi:MULTISPECIES: hypothetical protein [Anoxybacillus]|uniref:Uncharacterized protein n=1 Tax=Anoxybacillus flavithermus TaxID=33934 RepID=A0A178TG08_9BACL|nr:MULTISPECIES: hypothetical protein [Anoxybacillus]ASA96853.1 hypothetical protein CA592_08560 [Anoxybacillus flavithermus]MBE2905370.1 hypothetical protein [Anoxybacillus flavithermus]MBE2919266.1 hypothetical protein [Anoxybacillus flavithermus]MBE2921317.1 hypothetical protein [Anoxybacillus flavithermus]MBE2923940.1 hypothetical protein [Anoxybacillus flavithermus]